MSRADMMGETLRGISVSNQNDKVEPDALADFNFIIGDLNSRFKSTFTKHIENVDQSMHMLKELDELHEMRNEKMRYPGYQEKQINFMPTYKCVPDSLEYKYINKKDQCPSYTDRILLKRNDHSSNITFNKYDSNPEILGSDHRPVFLDCTISIDFVNFIDT